MNNDYKECKKCKEIKSIDEFCKDKYAKDGRVNKCKKCRYEIFKEWYAAHTTDQKEKSLKYYYDNQEERLEYRKKYVKDHVEELKEKRKIYTKNNKDKLRKYGKEYKTKNRENINKRDRIRRKQDITYRLRKNVSRSIRTALKSYDTKNGFSCLKYLSYTIQQLKDHLEKQFEPWMSWENHGNYLSDKQTWQIDHIIPQSKLPYDSMEHPNFQKCWALENLRPLLSIDNLEKNNKCQNNSI